MAGLVPRSLEINMSLRLREVTAHGQETARFTPLNQLKQSWAFSEVDNLLVPCSFMFRGRPVRTPIKVLTKQLELEFWQCGAYTLRKDNFVPVKLLQLLSHKGIKCVELKVNKLRQLITLNKHLNCGKWGSGWKCRPNFSGHFSPTVVIRDDLALWASNNWETIIRTICELIVMVSASFQWALARAEWGHASE